MREACIIRELGKATNRRRASGMRPSARWMCVELLRSKTPGIELLRFEVVCMADRRGLAARLHTDPRGFMGWLRAHTLALGKPSD